MKCLRIRLRDINKFMSNIIEFPLDRRIEQMAIDDGFDVYEKLDLAELDTEHFLSELLKVMFDNEYGIDAEEHVFDVSFLYETLKSFVYKMNGTYHPIQSFAQNLYADVIDSENSPQLDLFT